MGPSGPLPRYISYDQHHPADSAEALARARQAYSTYSKANDLDEAVANAKSKSEGRDAQPGSIGKLTGQAIAKLRAGRSDWARRGTYSDGNSTWGPPSILSLKVDPEVQSLAAKRPPYVDTRHSRFLRRAWTVSNAGMTRAVESIVIRLVDCVAVQSEFAAKCQLDAIGKETPWG